MPVETGTRISLTRVFINILYIYSSSPPSLYFELVNHPKMERIYNVDQSTAKPASRGA